MPIIDPVLGISTDAVRRIEDGQKPFSLHSQIIVGEDHEHMIICIGFHGCPLELAIFHDTDKGERTLKFLRQNGEGRKDSKKLGVGGLT